jgi:hypothetical protein
VSQRPRSLTAQEPSRNGKQRGENMDLRVSGLGLEARARDAASAEICDDILMAVFGFSHNTQDVVWLRKAIFRMTLSRAKSHLSDPSDTNELTVSQAMEGISFELLTADQSARLTEAVYQGTLDLREEVAEGKATEEPVRPGIEEKLDEILALLSRFRDQDRESRQP